VGQFYQEKKTMARQRHRPSRQRKAVLKQVAVKRQVKLQKELKTQDQNPTPLPLAEKNPMPEIIGSPTFSANETSGITDPLTAPEPAPVSSPAVGDVSMDDLLGLIQQQTAGNTDLSEGDGQRMLDRLVLSSLVTAMFGIWAKSSGDKRKILTPNEANDWAGAAECMLNKHWPGLLQNFGVEINFLCQTLIIVLPRLSSENHATNTGRLIKDHSPIENGKAFQNEGQPAAIGGPEPIA
jgi:hypothetical protein